jgi:hypothetical protein
MTTPDLPIQGQPVAKLAGLLWSDILIIIAAGVILAVGLICWAIFIRKPGESSDRASATPKVSAPHSRGKRRHKKRRRDHRSRNPSLAETGGLPSSSSTSGGAAPEI